MPADPQGPGVRWTRLYEEAEPQRVNRWLAQSGVCSRREAEALIGDGLVSIDGEVVTDAGRKITAGQTLTLASGRSSAMTVLVHKPVGVVSAHPDPGQVEARRLLTLAARMGEGPVPAADDSLPPAGRLDRESRGLLILSSDGVVAKAVIGPESSLDKEYVVRVTGGVTEGGLKMLRYGLRLDGRQLRAAKVSVVADQTLRMILREGRNRQIRRMCEHVGLHVVDLMRTRIGPLRLDGLPEGRWRTLSPEERTALLTASARERD